MVARAVAWLDARLFAIRPAEGMVICRIVFGAVLFGCYLTKAPRVPAIYGPEGVAGSALRTRSPESWPQGLPIDEIFQWLHRIESLETIWILFALLLVSSLAFSLGAFTRLSGCIALVLHAVFHAHANLLYGGWAEMIKPFMLYVILSNAGEFWSIDAWRRGRGRQAPVVGIYWPQLLLKIHVCTMYAITGWPRLYEPAWSEGTMLLAALGDGWYSRYSLDWFLFREVLRVACYGAVLLEPLAPLLLFIPRIAPWCALALIGMHVTLEVLMNLGWWQYMMIAALTTFLPAAWLRLPHR